MTISAKVMHRVKETQRTKVTLAKRTHRAKVIYRVILSLCQSDAPC